MRQEVAAAENFSCGKKSRRRQILLTRKIFLDTIASKLNAAEYFADSIFKRQRASPVAAIVTRARLKFRRRSEFATDS